MVDFDVSPANIPITRWGRTSRREAGDIVPSVRRYLVLIVFACVCLGLTLVVVHRINHPEPCRRATLLSECR